MALAATEDSNVFFTAIRGFASGEAVEYYLSAADRSGRRESLPRSAPNGFYVFVIQ